MITTHVLDTTRGCPGTGIPVTLEVQVSEQEWKQLGSDKTDVDGRARKLLAPGAQLSNGVYRLTFDVGT